jgi:hypothetical protein
MDFLVSAENEYSAQGQFVLGEKKSKFGFLGWQLQVAFDIQDI